MKYVSNVVGEIKLLFVYWYLYIYMTIDTFNIGVKKTWFNIIMGCGKSKIKRISLTPDNVDESAAQNGIDTISGKVNGQINHPMSSSIELQNNGNIPGETRNEEDEATTILPNRLLLSAIPVSDLGDSLDSRHLSESLNMSQSLGGGFLKHHMR